MKILYYYISTIKKFKLNINKKIKAGHSRKAKKKAFHKGNNLLKFYNTNVN